MKKTKFISLVLFLIICISSVIYAKIVYKDITSISIKTNFDFDYDTIHEEGVDDITFNSDGVDSDNVYVASTAKYQIDSAEWYMSDVDNYLIGGEPRIVVYLSTKEYENDYDNNNEYYYRFLNSYSSSSCYIGGGTFVSAQRLSMSSLKVIFKVRPIRGSFEEPLDAYWENDRGVARWTPPSTRDSGYYDIVLYRNQTSIAHIDSYNGTSYSLYKYMTQPGDYMFKVRTVPGTDTQGQYGKRSDYVESGYLSITQDMIYVNNGVISTNDGTAIGNNVGWVKQNGKWYFIRPDGQMVRNGWVESGGKWYLLGNDGAMLTGFVTANNLQYYLENDGAMHLGWLNSGDEYYYFDTDSGQHNGAMQKNAWVNYNGQYFYFDENGKMVTGWKQIMDKNGNTGFYYFYPKGSTNGLYGYMAHDTVINGFTLGSDGKWNQY